MLSILAFLLTIGILVVVHEYGHYLFARMFKVRVLTFSIGFGPKIFSYQTKSNEWRLSLIPFGGYVRMLDEREGYVADNEKHFAFNNKHPYQKILISFAGPLFNILFAIVIYYFIAIYGTTQVKPVISSFNPNLIQNTLKVSITTPSQIIEIDGYKPISWADADKKFNRTVMTKPMFNLQLQSASTANIQTVPVNGETLRRHFSADAYLETMGLYPVSYIPIIAYVEPRSVADKSGLKVGDKIVAINSKPVTNWFFVADTIHSSSGVQIKLKVSRGGKELDYVVTPIGKNDSSGQLVGMLGIMPTLDEKLLQQNSFTQRHDMLSSLYYAVNECYRVIQFNLKSIYQILTGIVSAYNLGGPITIAKIGAGAIHDGVSQFAEFLALISIGLAIMNLLPIPVLDGGHILIYIIELIINKPLPNSIVEFIFKLGFVFVLGLSLFAVFNDMMRL